MKKQWFKIIFDTNKDADNGFTTMVDATVLDTCEEEVMKKARSVFYRGTIKKIEKI